MSPIPTLHDANNRNLKRTFTAVAVSPSSPSPSPSPSPLSSSISTSSKRKIAIATTGLFKRKGRRVADGSSIQVCRKDLSFLPSAISSSLKMCDVHVKSFMSMYNIESTLPSQQSRLKMINRSEEDRNNYNNNNDNDNKFSSNTTTIIINDDDNNNNKNNINTTTTTTTTNNDSNNNSIKDNSDQLSNWSTQSSLDFHKQDVPVATYDSTDSSPTTTISTLDSLISDISPSSSPESPHKSIELSPSPNLITDLEAYRDITIINCNPPRFLSVDEKRPMTSPNLKRKNPKSLALNLSSNVEPFQSSEPCSPCFIKPPTLKDKKKPSLLSLNTGAANNNLVDMPSSPGMPTMLQRRGLRHAASTPHILSTPRFGPAGGMSLRPHMGSFRLKDNGAPIHSSLNRNGGGSSSSSNHTIHEENHETSTGIQMATRLPGVTVGGDTFDRAHAGGEDSKMTGYPDGPILMHEPNVYLYSEPKVQEAMKFDVIINVAREVKCPFGDGFESELRSQLRRSQSQSAATGPRKMTPQSRIPEYIHVPWDHSTDVKDELWDLCKLIESRVHEGKKVLVHCQQGASRSATLIIAYGMYVNQDIGPNEAYQLAQSKSEWVNPNMSLLFSLNDFKKVIEEKKVQKPSARCDDAGLTNENKSSPSNKPMLIEAAEIYRTSSPLSPNLIDETNVLDQNSRESESASIDTTISELGAFEFELSKPKKRECKDLVVPCVDAINSSVERLPRLFGTDVGLDCKPSSNDSSFLSPRVVEFPRPSFFSPTSFSPTLRNYQSLAMAARSYFEKD